MAVFVSSCTFGNADAAYPVIDKKYTVTFSCDGGEVSGRFEYMNSRNYTFAYSSPTLIEGFTVSFSGGDCTVSFNGMTHSGSKLPFAQDSPVGVVIDVFGLLENEAFTLASCEDGICAYVFEQDERKYTVFCDDITGKINRIAYKDTDVELIVAD